MCFTLRPDRNTVKRVDFRGKLVPFTSRSDFGNPGTPRRRLLRGYLLTYVYEPS
jgi:hypothetical protein